MVEDDLGGRGRGRLGDAGMSGVAGDVGVVGVDQGRRGVCI